MKLILPALIGTLLVSGCICTGDFSSLEGIIGGGEEECPTPYIEYGTECCLDRNGNDICDSDEEDDQPQEVTTTQPYVPQTTIPETVTTQTIATTQTTQTTQTTIVYSNTYNCVSQTGWDPDSVYYLYSTRCGDNFLAKASTADARTGVTFTKIKIGGYVAEEKIKLMECFYGGYYEGHAEFTYCPRLLCPKNGEIKNLKGTGSSSVLSQMLGFAKTCT